MRSGGHASRHSYEMKLNFYALENTTGMTFGPNGNIYVSVWGFGPPGKGEIDTAPATCEALPHVVEAVGDLCEVYVDGGIRRGSDVLKAIALGARAVLVGRPVLWGLCVSGEEGASQVLEILRRELDEAMLLCGCSTLSDIGRWLLQP